MKKDRKVKAGNVSKWEDRQSARRLKELRERQIEEVDEREVFNKMKNETNLTKGSG